MGDLLKEYNRKRDFKKTKEPKGKLHSKKKKKLIFVVQEHHASHLHYDFRLELDGVLKSWAIPKGPSLDPKDKRLAVQTEDHPLGYAKFHGTIPKGEYGGGEVFIWDKGSWSCKEGMDPHEGLKKGRLEFSLEGNKLHGNWVLIRTHYKGAKKNWLLIKRSDEEAVGVNAEDTAWPGFIRPQLPRLVSAPPSSESWIHEMKYDGYRIQTHLKNNVAHFFTRKGLDWSLNFPHLLNDINKIKVHNAIIDGEIVALDKEGRSHFQGLQHAVADKEDRHLVYYVFDLLYLNGEDLRERSLLERKKLLKSILPKSKHILFSDHIEVSGKAFYETACDHKLEGMISKMADAPYRSGRNDLWLKTKCVARQEFVIGGYTEGKGTRSSLGSLLLGVMDKGKLRYTGHVGTGFDQKTLEQMKRELAPLEIDHSPFGINSPNGRRVHWVNPKLVCEVSFANWTEDQILRSAVFMGVRKDKDEKEIIKEDPKQLELTSPDKILFKKEKISKKNIADFYKKISKVMLPYLANRPLSLVRCPNGTEGSCFFQKHISGEVPAAFHPLEIEDEGGKATYFSIDSLEGLMELVQLSAFEIHCWNSKRDLKPDQFVIDFDPGPGVPWKEVIAGAFELKKILDALKLKSFVKLTGGKGIHVHVPIAPLYDWEQIKSFTQTLALEMISRYPDKYVASMSKKKRNKKIFIDYLRNAHGATAVAPYVLRNKPKTAVALPLTWNELKRAKSSDEYSLARALKKIKSRKSDPWKGYLKLHQRIKILDP